MQKPELKDTIFTEDFIKKHTVSWWKYWLLPLIHPFTWRQAKWSYYDEGGKKLHTIRGLVKW